MIDNFEKIVEEVTLLKKENLKQKNTIEELSLNIDRKIDELINEVIRVIDSFDKSEAVVKEKGLDQEENAQKAVKRMLQPKKVVSTILDKYNVQRIDILEKQVNPDLCTIVETEPDSEKEDGIVLAIEKRGLYKRRPPDT